MGNIFTLESLEEEIENEYAPLTFQAQGTEFVMQSLLRIGKKDRGQVIERLKSIGAAAGSDEESDKPEDDEELDEDATIEAIEFVITKVTKDGQGRKLVTILNHDLLRLMKLLDRWTKATQPGEAKGSDN
jgi:hypothetical protein